MTALRDRFSVRTLGMLLCAYIWAWLGVGNLLSAPLERPDVIYLYIDPVVRAGAWFAAAAAGAATAWSRRGSVIGLILLTIPPATVELNPSSYINLLIDTQGRVGWEMRSTQYPNP